MPFKSHPGVPITHATAVVCDLDQGLAAVLDDQVYLRSARINGIFHQFLDRTRRTLNNLAGSNLVGNIIGQQLNDVWQFCANLAPAI